MAVLLVLLTALFIVLTIVDTGSQHVTRRGIWLSILFGVLPSNRPSSSLAHAPWRVCHSELSQ